MTRAVTIAVTGLFVAVGLAFPQEFTGGFSFYLPPEDSSFQECWPSFSEAVRPGEFVTINGEGHFAAGGKRLRFFGTNLVADGCFPVKSKAPWIAARLRKMGFNLVRLHHMDNPWSPGSLFQQGSDTRHLNPVTLDRLEYLIAHLKRNGIRVNVNLHVSRTFRREDGVPYADSLRDFAKGVSLFDRRLIELQKEYARQLLTHVNPYTRLPLKDDPVMAMVEITNENSLYYMWRQDLLAPIREGGNLTYYHARLLDSLWCQFLRDKYGSTENLRLAWGGAELRAARDLLKGGTIDSDPALRNWRLEVHSPAAANQAVDTSDPAEGRLSARVVVTATDGVDWHVQWQQAGLAVHRDSVYVLQFLARADAPRDITVVIMKNADPWTTYAYGRFRLEPNWQTFSMSWRPDQEYTNLRVSFFLGASRGTYWFDDLHLYEGLRYGLAEDERLEAGTVRRIPFSACPSYSDARVADQTEFYIRLQESFFSDMENYLRTEVGVKVPIVRTNWNFGLVDLYVQSQADYVDNHAYWDHPQFPGEPWSPVDWFINNTAMVLETNGATIGRLFAGRAWAGKPYTVSEYDHPFPNRYQTEGVVFITAYSAFHDADGFMFFEYASTSDDWETDLVRGFFSDHRNTAIMAHMPTCALALRAGFVAPARQVIPLAYSYREDVLLEPSRGYRGWEGPSPVDPRLALLHSLRNVDFQSPSPLDASHLPAVSGPPYLSDTGEILWDPLGLLRVASPRFLAFTGMLDRFAGLETGPWRVVSADGFTTLTAVCVDSLPFDSTNRVLVALASRVQNDGMIWDGVRTVHDQWGRPPTFVEPRRVVLELATPADSVRIFPLSRKGESELARSWRAPVVGGRFRIELDQAKDRTVWYGLKIYRGPSGAENESSPQQIPRRFAIESLYPNPWRPSACRADDCYLQLAVPHQGEVAIAVFDLRGRKVMESAPLRAKAGRLRLALGQVLEGADRLPTGVYLLKAALGGSVEVRKWLVLK